MEEEAWVGRLGGGIAVAAVAQDGMADVVAVHTQLMPPSGLGKEPQARALILMRRDLEARVARLALGGIYAHPARPVGPNRCVDAAGRRANASRDQRDVRLLGVPLGKLLVEVAVRLGMAGEDQHAAHGLIQAMYHEQPLAARSFQLMAHDRYRWVAFWNGGDACWLVYDDDVGIAV